MLNHVKDNLSKIDDKFNSKLCHEEARSDAMI